MGSSIARVGAELDSGRLPTRYLGRAGCLSNPTGVWIKRGAKSPVGFGPGVGSGRIRGGSGTGAMVAPSVLGPLPDQPGHLRRQDSPRTARVSIRQPRVRYVTPSDFSVRCPSRNGSSVDGRFSWTQPCCCAEYSARGPDSRFGVLHMWCHHCYTRTRDIGSCGPLCDNARSSGMPSPLGKPRESPADGRLRRIPPDEGLGLTGRICCWIQGSLRSGGAATPILDSSRLAM